MKKAAELHSASDDTPGVFPILGATALVLVLNLLAMLTAERVLKAPFVASLGRRGSGWRMNRGDDRTRAYRLKTEQAPLVAAERISRSACPRDDDAQVSSQDPHAASAFYDVVIGDGARTIQRCGGEYTFLVS